MKLAQGGEADKRAAFEVGGWMLAVMPSLMVRSYPSVVPPVIRC